MASKLERLGKRAAVMIKSNKKKSLRERLKSGLQSLVGGSKARKAKKAIKFSKGQVRKKVGTEMGKYIDKDGKSIGSRLLNESDLLGSANKAVRKMKKDKR